MAQLYTTNTCRILIAPKLIFPNVKVASYRQCMDIVICEPIRTPVGRMGGVLAPLTAAELATTVLTELVRRTGLAEGDIDDVVLGQGYPNGESPAIGRVAALTPAWAPVCRGCRSTAGAARACRRCCMRPGRSPPARHASSSPGGAESMSNVEHYALGRAPGSGRAASRWWTVSTARGRPPAASHIRWPAA